LNTLFSKTKATYDVKSFAMVMQVVTEIKISSKMFALKFDVGFILYLYFG